MTKNKNQNKSTLGSRLFGLAFLTTIVFLILHWTGVIDWKWVWVLSPLWISMALSLVLNIIIDAIKGIGDWIDINRIR